MPGLSCRRWSRLSVAGGVLGVLDLPKVVDGRREQSVRFAGGDGALVFELLGQQGAHGGTGGDFRVEGGLSVRRIVRLVVSPAAIANEVDQEIVLERIAIGQGHAGD